MRQKIELLKCQLYDFEQQRLVRPQHGAHVFEQSIKDQIRDMEWRLNVYKGMKQRVLNFIACLENDETENVDFCGFCSMAIVLTGKTYNGEKEVQADFPELWLYKPEPTHSYTQWFAYSVEGYRKRLNILNSIINGTL